MEWLTTNTEFDGFPLYLRIPNYRNIWQYKSKYSKLFCVTHEFESVKNNGLPTSEYNESLFDFDGEVVNLFDQNRNGIIFLVETYGGARNYWFYVRDTEIATKAFEALKDKNSDKKLEMGSKNDSEWGFIAEYPVKLYKSE